MDLPASSHALCADYNDKMCEYGVNFAYIYMYEYMYVCVYKCALMQNTISLRAHHTQAHVYPILSSQKLLR